MVLYIMCLNFFLKQNFMLKRYECTYSGNCIAIYFIWFEIRFLICLIWLLHTLLQSTKAECVHVAFYNSKSRSYFYQIVLLGITKPQVNLFYNIFCREESMGLKCFELIVCQNRVFSFHRYTQNINFEILMKQNTSVINGNKVH